MKNSQFAQHVTTQHLHLVISWFTWWNTQEKRSIYAQCVTTPAPRPLPLEYIFGYTQERNLTCVTSALKNLKQEVAWADTIWFTKTNHNKEDRKRVLEALKCILFSSKLVEINMHLYFFVTCLLDTKGENGCYHDPVQGLAQYPSPAEASLWGSSRY